MIESDGYTIADFNHEFPDNESCKSWIEKYGRSVQGTLYESKLLTYRGWFYAVYLRACGVDARIMRKELKVGRVKVWLIRRKLDKELNHGD